MDYEREMKAICDVANTLALSIRRLAWSVARTVPAATLRTVETRIEQMKTESEPFRRLPRAEHERIARQIEAEERTARTLAAGVARTKVEPHIDPLDAKLRAYREHRKRDVSLSFPDALDRFGPGDMVMLELLRETIRPQIETASIDDLTERYDRAWNRRDARGRVEAELIEARMVCGRISTIETDIPAVKALAERIEMVQDLRVEPFSDLGKVEDVIAEARKAVSRADVAQVRPINPEHDPAAKQAHEAAEHEYRAEASGQ